MFIAFKPALEQPGVLADVVRQSGKFRLRKRRRQDSSFYELPLAEQTALWTIRCG